MLPTCQRSSEKDENIRLQSVWDAAVGADLCDSLRIVGHVCSGGPCGEEFHSNIIFGQCSRS